MALFSHTLTPSLLEDLTYYGDMYMKDVFAHDLNLYKKKAENQIGGRDTRVAFSGFDATSVPHTLSVIESRAKYGTSDQSAVLCVRTNRGADGLNLTHDTLTLDGEGNLRVFDAGGDVILDVRAADKTLQVATIQTAGLLVDGTDSIIAINSKWRMRVVSDCLTFEYNVGGSLGWVRQTLFVPNPNTGILAPPASTLSLSEMNAPNSEDYVVVYNSASFKWTNMRATNLATLDANNTFLGTTTLSGATGSVLNLSNDKSVKITSYADAATLAGALINSGTIKPSSTGVLALSTDGTTTKITPLSSTGATLAGTLTGGTLNPVTLGVSGNATVTGTLGVTGVATFSDNVSIATAGKTLTVGTGLTTLGGALTVAGTTTFNGAVKLNTTSSILSLSTDGATTKITPTATGATLAGTLTGGTLNPVTLGVSGNAAVTGTLGVTGVATFSDNVSIAAGKTLTVGNGLTTLGGALTVAGTTTLSGATGSVLNLSNDKLVNITSSAAAATLAGTLTGGILNPVECGIIAAMPSLTTTGPTTSTSFLTDYPLYIHSKTNPALAGTTNPPKCAIAFAETTASTALLQAQGSIVCVRQSASNASNTMQFNLSNDTALVEVASLSAIAIALNAPTTVTGTLGVTGVTTLSAATLTGTLTAVKCGMINVSMPSLTTTGPMASTSLLSDYPLFIHSKTVALSSGNRPKCAIAFAESSSTTATIQAQASIVCVRQSATNSTNIMQFNLTNGTSLVEVASLSTTAIALNAPTTVGGGLTVNGVTTLNDNTTLAATKTFTNSGTISGGTVNPAILGALTYCTNYSTSAPPRIFGVERWNLTNEGMSTGFYFTNDGAGIVKCTRDTASTGTTIDLFASCTFEQIIDEVNPSAASAMGPATKASGFYKAVFTDTSTDLSPLPIGFWRATCQTWGRFGASGTFRVYSVKEFLLYSTATTGNALYVLALGGLSKSGIIDPIHTS